MMDHAVVERLEEDVGKADRSPGVQRFFEGMAWPIPIAFSGAIAAMRFEQGDVVYRDRRAYDTLEGQIPKGLSAIQVILPKRSARATPSESDGDRRQSNWQSEVTVELIDLARGQKETRVLTQGKLAMAIFRGDEDWLEPDREEPQMPRSARALQQRLDQTLASFDARQVAKRGCRFVFAVDLASDTSLAKAAGVEESLRATGALERIELSAELAGVEDAQTYHPTAVVRCLVMPNRTTEEVLPILRDRLYGGASDRAGDSGLADDSDSSEGVKTTPDRFSVGRHGILQAIPAEPVAIRSRSSRS
jgi:hypothetical protein